MLNGIDLSQYQGLVDFNTLKGEADFVWIRANYGTPNNSSVLNIDTQFERNKTLVRQVDIPHGFYHFAYPQYNSAQSEALYFASIIDIRQNELLALDFEEPVANPVEWALTFLQTLSNSFGGYKPLIYMNLNLSNSYDWSPVIDAGFGSWIAEYNGNKTMPVTKWSVVAFKQWTSAATIGGINGLVDGDVFYGDINQFNKYGYQPPVIQKEITPTVTQNPTVSETTPVSSSTSSSTTDISPTVSVSPAQSVSTSDTTQISSVKSNTTTADTTNTSTAESTPQKTNNIYSSTNIPNNHIPLQPNWILSWWSGLISLLKRIFHL